MPDPNPFSPAAIQQSVHDTLEGALKMIPEGKRGAILVDASLGHVEVVVAHRVGDSWNWTAGGGWDGHHVTGKIAVMGTW